MEGKNLIFLVICGAFALVGAVAVMYQIYRLTVLDADARGLKHPKFWGVIAMNGNNSGGLLMYLIGRRKYPIVNVSESRRLEMEKRKKKAGVGIIFLAAGGIGMVICVGML